MRLWICIFALLASDLMLAQDEFYDDDELTADELDAEDEFDDAHDQAQHQFESVDSRVTEQQTTIDALEQREMELRHELERLREEAAVKAAEDEARRIALGEALKSYKVPQDDDY